VCEFTVARRRRADPEQLAQLLVGLELGIGLGHQPSPGVLPGLEHLLQLGRHFEEPGPGDRAAAFGIEDVAALQILPPQLAERPDFLAGEGVRAIDTVLGPPHMDAAAIKLDHVPGQFAEFAGT
jgi:hypothetical protein